MLHACNKLLDWKLVQTMSVFEEFTTPIKKPEREIVGREKEMFEIYASLCRPEICNVILLAPAGAGKTATVQGLSQMDERNDYYEVNLSKMRAAFDDAGFSKAIGDLCNEAIEKNSQGNGCVLFIDEFHIIVQLSTSAVEAIKPILADSGTRGLKIIAATTYEPKDTELQMRFLSICTIELSKSQTDIFLLTLSRENH